jgi:hypothetical protein
MTSIKNNSARKWFWILGIGCLAVVVLITCLCLVAVKVIPALAIVLFPSHILTPPPVLTPSPNSNTPDSSFKGTSFFDNPGLA